MYVHGAWLRFSWGGVAGAHKSIRISRVRANAPWRRDVVLYSGVPASQARGWQLCGVQPQQRTPPALARHRIIPHPLPIIYSRTHSRLLFRFRYPRPTAPPPATTATVYPRTTTRPIVDAGVRDAQTNTDANHRGTIAPVHAIVFQSTCE